MIKRWLIVALVIAIYSMGSGCSFETVQSAAQALKQKDEQGQNVRNYFANFNGTFVIRDIGNGTTIVINEKQANKKLSPMSTFEILNSLIALETGVIQGENAVRKWDGSKYPEEEWNRDHTLASALTNSVEWYYQSLAREIGEKKMKSYIERVGYGNNDVSGGIDKFWLDSTLRISALEQVDFLTKLYKEELPFHKRATKTAKKIMVLKSSGDFVFAGKTGSRNNELGWFVGYITKGDSTYVFATNIEGTEDATGFKARQITEEILKDFQLFPSNPE